MDRTEISRKDKASTWLLCLFLGFIGAHKFYVGKHVQGVIQLTLFVCAPIVSAIGDPIVDLSYPVIGAWVLVDFIIILANKFRDSEGKWITNDAAPAPEREPAARPRPATPRAKGDQRLQQRILMCAKQDGGAIAPTTVAMRTGFDIDDVKNHLESLVDKGYAELQARKNGTLVYVFPDMLTDERRSELELL